MTGREAAAEALAGVLGDHQWHHTRDTHCACGFRTPLAQLAVEGYLAHVAAAVLAAIERGDIPGVGVLPESETLTEGEWREVDAAAYGHPGTSDLRAAVERILASRARPASVDAEDARTDLTGSDPGFASMCPRCGRGLVSAGEWCCGGWTAPVAADREPDDLLGRAIRTLLPGLRVANYVERWATGSPAVQALSILSEHVGEGPVAAGETVDPDVPTAHTRRPAADREPDGSWVCGRCGGSPKSHAAVTSECVYDPIFRREPDGLRAKVEAEQRERIAQAVKALPTTRTQAWTKGWDSVSLADVLALLAHPATDQEEADRDEA